jgi:hypothetical protein
MRSATEESPRSWHTYNPAPELKAKYSTKLDTITTLWDFATIPFLEAIFTKGQSTTQPPRTPAWGWPALVGYAG